MQRYNFLCFILALFATICLTGCFSIDMASIPKSEESHLYVSNECWYLFDCIPLACGNANENGWMPWVTFRNDLTHDKIQRRFMMTAQQLGKTKISNLSYSTDEMILFEIPGIQIPIPIPYLLTYRNIQLSGVVGEEEQL